MGEIVVACKNADKVYKGPKDGQAGALAIARHKAGPDPGST